jgi:hypothetical protein
LDRKPYDTAVTVRWLAVCHTCNRFHRIACAPSQLGAEIIDWEKKHPRATGCVTEYPVEDVAAQAGLDDRPYLRTGVGPQLLEYTHNTNFNFAYRASAAVTNALGALASSTTWVAGYESATIDNSTNKDLDILISTQVTVGTTPTINTLIEVSTVSMMDDSTWPDVFDGTTSAETVTSVGVKQGICLPLGYMNVDATTTNRVYYLSKRSVASQYGGVCPDKFVLFTAHNCVAALNSTGHSTFQQSVYIVGA